MRILMLSSDAYGGHGGIALYNRDIVEALAEMTEVREIVVIPRKMPFKPEPIPDNVRFLSEAVGGKARYICTVLQEACEAFDLVICGHINLLPLAALINIYKNSQLALMVYGIEVWRQPNALARYWLGKVDAVWSISAITRDRMNAWAKLVESKYTLLPNAIRLDRYGMGEKSANLTKRYNLEGKKVIMTLARLPGKERYKGVDEMLEIMPGLLEQEPSLRYLVAGDGNDRSRLEAKADILGLSGKVIFTGMVDETEKADLLRLANVFVLPGRAEGFGFVFLEALACGIPAVGSQLDGSREALRDGMLGELVDPTNPSSITDGVLCALRKPKGIPPGLSYFAWPAFSQRVADAVRSQFQ